MYKIELSAATDESQVWVKPGKAQNERMFSGLPPTATDARTSSVGSFVP